MSLSTKESSNSRKTVIGKYILDSISLGMYTHPLMSLREYIQNAVDAIDDFRDANGDVDKVPIEILVDGRNRSIRIKDKGTGICAKKAQRILHDLGKSEKEPLRNRGFRGIGRLGGLAYCEELKFVTKAKGESQLSVSNWNCEKIRRLINDSRDFHDAASILKLVTKFEQTEYIGDQSEHFFVVEMNGVRNTRNSVLNVPAIKSYLSQVAPLNFDTGNFRFSEKIDFELRRNVPSYETYSILVNGEHIYKPYGNRIILGKDTSENIEGIKFINLSNNSGRLAFGWLAETTLSGTINPSSLVDGVRVRCGNILIGDKNLISEFYREKRFNNYMIGEIHIIDRHLVPNSRRDDFEDNSLRDELYESFVREVGIPYSRKIRELSTERSEHRLIENSNLIIRRAHKLIEGGFVAQAQKSDLLTKLEDMTKIQQIASMRLELQSLIDRVNCSDHILNKQDGLLPAGSRMLLQRVLETIYSEIENKLKAEELIDKILCQLAHSKRAQH